MSRILRWLTGTSLILAAWLKAASLGDPAFSRTVVWYLCGGREGFIVALACLEFVLASLFILGVWSQRVALVLVAMLIVFTVALLVFRWATTDAVGGCGCFGSYQLPWWCSVGYNIVVAASVIYVTWAGRTREEPEGGQDARRVRGGA